MKLLVAALLLAAVVSVHAGDKEMMMLKKWAMHKACESCFGEENTKKFMIKMKTAYAKCSGQENPLLDLPMFNANHRVAGSLVHNAFHQHKHGHDTDWMNKAMRKYFLKKMFASFMKEQFAMDDDDMDMSADMDMDMEGPMRFFKQSRRNVMRRRYQRDTSKEILDLGEKLTEKLEMEEQKMQEKLGNMVCMLQECGILTKENEIAPVEDIVAKMNEEFEIADPWLADQIEQDVRKCHMFATSIPDEFFEDCTYPVFLGRVKMFKMCKKIAKLRTCMNYDMKNNLEKSFGLGLEDLEEETGMEAKNILPLVQKLLHGDMDH